MTDDDKRKAIMWLIGELTDEELKQVLMAPVVMSAMLRRVTQLQIAQAIDAATMEAHEHADHR